jgi:hypothetical protein
MPVDEDYLYLRIQVSWDVTLCCWLSGAQCCEGCSAFTFKVSTIQEKCCLVGATNWACSRPFQPEISPENAVCGVLCFNQIQDKVQLERHCSGSGCNDSISNDCDCIIGGGGST